MRLSDLQPELQHLVLQCLPTATDLCRAACTLRAWRDTVTTIAEARVRLHRPIAGREYALRALRAIERVVASVGPRPAHTGPRARTWRTEWMPLMTEQHDLTVPLDPMYIWHYDIDRLLGHTTHYADTVKYCVAECGWTRASVEAFTLLYNCGRGALGTAVADRSDRYAACTHTVIDGLLAATRRVVQPTYSNLVGEWSLSDVDDAWTALLAPGAAPGVRFTTRALTGALIACAEGFPDGRGLRIPLHGNSGTEWELQDSPIVCFRGAPADSHGLHALAQCARGIVAAPPFTEVVLERVDAPGAWRANGHAMQQRCFTVRVSYA
jgi:hypothetical protein